MSTFVRALRLPFITASVLPFIFGCLIAPAALRWPLFLLGILAVAAAHLGANLINDYADSKSGADWSDKRAYGFFGGSKLIQEGVLSEQFYLYGSFAFFAIALVAMGALAFVMQSAIVLYAALFVVALSWSYSAMPLRLSYHRLGEVVIFILFGPAIVMGGYYLMTGIFPSLASFLLSLPFAFLTTAILYVNEIPDALDDEVAGKRTWVSFFPIERAYVLYVVLMAAAFAAIALLAASGIISAWALLSLAAVVLVARAVRVLRMAPRDKMRLLESSKLTIATQTAVSIILIGVSLL